MRKPWNIVDVPVYSIATYQGERVNMNISTYVMPSSMKPKQYTVAVYHNTRTLENIRSGSDVVLQILNSVNIGLVRSLGKKSGFSFDKDAYLRKHELLTKWNGLEVINNACAYLSLRLIRDVDTNGDHVLCVFEVLRSKTNDENSVLTFQKLVERRVIL